MAPRNINRDRMLQWVDRNATPEDNPAPAQSAIGFGDFEMSDAPASNI